MTVTTTAVLLQNAGWVATVSTTLFVTGGGTTAERVASSSITYLSGAATASAGLAAVACTPGQTVTAVSLASQVTAFTCTGTGAAGGTSLTWNPQITITIGAANVAGTYSGTITHSVA